MIIKFCKFDFGVVGLQAFENKTLKSTLISSFFVENIFLLQRRNKKIFPERKGYNIFSYVYFQMQKSCSDYPSILYGYSPAGVKRIDEWMLKYSIPTSFSIENHKIRHSRFQYRLDVNWLTEVVCEIIWTSRKCKCRLLPLVLRKRSYFFYAELRCTMPKSSNSFEQEEIIPWPQVSGPQLLRLFPMGLLLESILTEKRLNELHLRRKIQAFTL